MSREFVPIDPNVSDAAYQDAILPHVSRTFALTIPQLPATLRGPVTCAYLLCRIADTIEDEPALPPDATFLLMNRFVAVVQRRAEAEPFAAELVPLLSDRTLPAEHDLVRNVGRVVRVLAGYNAAQRFAIERCVEIMGGGMHKFQRTASLAGLPTLGDLDDYCYYVAGVVGQMLTELFCDHDPRIEQQRAGLESLAVSFAQGLQMTNILKDAWEDRARGACWLPQEVFARHGIDLARLGGGNTDRRFDAAMRELIGIAHAHLRNALEYTLLIPGEQGGIRRFCCWAVGLAILTLRKIERTPGFRSGTEVKVSRSAVVATRILTDWFIKRDFALRQLFNFAARGVTLAAPAATRGAPRAPLRVGAALATQAQEAPPLTMPTSQRLFEGGAHR